MKLLPTFVAQFLLHLLKFISYDFGLVFEAVKVKKENFGSGILTNVSGFKFEDGYAPFIGFTSTIFLMVITSPINRVVVRDGKPVQRRTVHINMTFDQRFAEGNDVVEAVKTVTKVWNNPEEFFN